MGALIKQGTRVKVHTNNRAFFGNFVCQTDDGTITIRQNDEYVRIPGRDVAYLSWKEDENP